MPNRSPPSDPTNTAAIDRAVELASAIPDNETRSKALAGIAQQIAANNPTNTAAIDRAVELAGTIPNDRIRSQVLASIAGVLGDSRHFALAGDRRALDLGIVLTATGAFIQQPTSPRQDVLDAAATSVARIATSFG